MNREKKIKVFFNLKDFLIRNKIKVDFVVSAISGLDGLEPTIKIIKHTKKIAIANKESIICGWNLIEKELEDINKPELTPAQMDNVYLAVERAVEEFDFSDTGNFDIDYTLDYDSRIQCETHDFCNSTDLVELICNEVTKLFKEAKCPTDEKNARDDKEAEKLADNS